MKATILLSISISISLQVPLTTAQRCKYDTNPLDHCINAQRTGSRAFEFPPLFPSAATLVYALDPLNTDEIQAELDRNATIYETADSTSTRNASELNINVTRTAFWLEYPEINITTEDTLFISHIGMLFTNASNSISGANNGCDGLLGTNCTSFLKAYVKARITPRGSRQDDQRDDLDRVLNSRRRNWYRGRGRNGTQSPCPVDLWDDGGVLPTEEEEGEDRMVLPLAIEANKLSESHNYTTDSLPSGDSSHTYNRPIDRERSLEEQIQKAGVGIITRVPIFIPPVYNRLTGEYEGGINFTDDDVQVELICSRADAVVEGGSRVGRVGMGWLLVIASVAAAFAGVGGIY
ncbi:hypothetical protein BJX70DRAFT_393939 [Aspergillus crustosus]